MADLSKLSDKELDRLIAQEEAKSKDLSKLSDEELDAAIMVEEQKLAKPYTQLQALKTGIETGATFGARPAVAGLAGGLGSIVGTLETPRQGESILARTVRAFQESPQAFREARKGALQEQQKLSAEHPGTFLAGEIGGSLLVPGAAIKAIRGGATGVRGAARIGAAMGAGRALGEAEDVGEAIEHIGSGAIIGAAGEGLIKGAGRAKQALAQKLEEQSQKNVIGASGAMLKDFRRIFGKGAEKRITDVAFEEGIVKAGDTVESIAEKSAAKASQYGKVIGEAYKAADEALSDPAKLAKLTKDQVLKLAKTDLVPEDMAIEFYSKTADELKGIAGGPQALARLENELNVLSSLGKSANPTELNNFRMSVDNMVNFDKTVKDMPLVQQQLVKLRNFVKDKVDSRINTIDEVVGGNIGKTLKEANRKFSSLIELANISKDRVMREEANKAFGLRQSITTAGGAAAGAAIGGDLDSAVKGAAIGASLKTIERYGPAIAAKVQKIVADRLKQSSILSEVIKNNPQAYQILLERTADELMGR